MEEGLPLTRDAKYPGPRCLTHHRAVRANRSITGWVAHLWENFGITDTEYWAIYEAQGGVCYICERAKGLGPGEYIKGRKRLAVDHDHKTGIIRGLLCASCNRRVLGHLRDEPQALVRAAYYLIHPPAVEVIGVRIVPGGPDE
ncbi:endonuclease VII [Mycobacterium phage SWU2]|uniref:Endonuclease VII n=1 Tax=Mycobacterium phage SWU2 TaxID=2077150 RepID=A0A2K9VI31_9CAUD|nr:endonuclease VII [Mycobacterium phage SWU2]AUV62016.1 endonuclease VII [Mycobacterium phage SWU2]